MPTKEALTNCLTQSPHKHRRSLKTKTGILGFAHMEEVSPGTGADLDFWVVPLKVLRLHQVTLPHLVRMLTVTIPPQIVNIQHHKGDVFVQ
jgi:hypothetical protein